MKKFTLFVAALLTAGSAFSALKVEKLWESTADIPAVANAKQGVGYDGTFYIQDKSAKKIYSFVKDGENVTRSEYATSDEGQGFAMDDAGNLACRVGYFATGTPTALKIYKKGDPTPIDITFTLPDPGRSDYNSASGDFFSEAGGYVWFLCQNKTQLQYVKICNGGATAADITTGKMGGVLTTLPGTQSHIITGTATTWFGQSRSADFYAWDGTTIKAATPDGAKKSTLGGCIFTINGKEIMAYNSGSTNYTSEWKVRNMTDGEDIATGLKIGDGTTTSTSYANWLTASKIDDNHYYIHQIFAGVGIALWKVSDEGSVNIENVKAVKANLFSTADGLQAEFDGEATIEIYTTTGKLIQKSVANNIFNVALKAGAYLVRINGETFKFVK